MKMNLKGQASFLIFLCCLIVPVPAPVPRCSPWIIINKLVEWTSLWSDSNAYFPIGPCEYGGPIGALLAGDTGAVFLLETPDRIPRHNIYEFVWFLKTGFLRMLRMFFGLERFEFDLGILLEGYQHYTPNVRTTQLGHGTQRRPELIDDKNLWTNFVGGKILSLFVDGPDFFPTNYTPVGPLKRNDSGRRKVKGKDTQGSGIIRRRRPGVHHHDIKRQFTQRHEVRSPVTSPVTSLRTEDSDQDEQRQRAIPLIENGGWKPVRTSQ